jgi:hypothetical protein
MFAVGATMYRAAFPNFRSSSSDIFLRRVRNPSTSKVASWMDCIAVAPDRRPPRLLLYPYPKEKGGNFSALVLI